MLNRAKGVINITNELKPMTITFVTFIHLVIIKLTDKRNIIQHNLSDVIYLGTSFSGEPDGVNTTIEEDGNLLRWIP